MFKSKLAGCGTIKQTLYNGSTIYTNLLQGHTNDSKNFTIKLTVECEMPCNASIGNVSKSISKQNRAVDVNNGFLNESEVQPSVKPEVKLSLKQEIQPSVKPEVQPSVKSERKPEAKSEVNPEVQRLVKSEVKTLVKSGVKPEMQRPAKSDEVQPSMFPTAPHPPVELEVQRTLTAGVQPSMKPELHRSVERKPVFKASAQAKEYAFQSTGNLLSCK